MMKSDEGAYTPMNDLPLAVLEPFIVRAKQHTYRGRKQISRALNRLAGQVHSSMARTIYPFHTLMDGDVLYAVATNEIEHPTLSVAGLGMLASELMWDASMSIYQ
jgi:hypothetical protein